MQRIRILLVWLVMAAIPLQGLAAASMLFCGAGAKGVAVQTATDHDHTPAAGSTAAHDHSMHAHSQAQAENSGDSADHSQMPDAAHKCGVCASCCHAAAITQLPQRLVFTAGPQAVMDEPFVLIFARPSQVPDKPPRA